MYWLSFGWIWLVISFSYTTCNSNCVRLSYDVLSPLPIVHFIHPHPYILCRDGDPHPYIDYVGMGTPIPTYYSHPYILCRDGDPHPYILIVCRDGDCHGVYCPTSIMSGGQNMAAIFGPGQNMADTFSQNVAARFSPTLQYMVRARTICGWRTERGSWI